MRIAVVGCGAVGSYYGAKLARAGHEVHFLLRSDYEAVRRHGVRIRSSQEEFRVRPNCARVPDEIGPCEWLLIGLKTTANDQFGRLLPPLVDTRTAVVTLQNGLGNEEQLARFFPVAQVLGGLCFVCLNRLEPGLIHHIGYGQVVLGEFQRPPTPRTHTLATAFVQAGVPCAVTDNLTRAHWEKLVWNVPFNGLGVAGVAGLDALVSGPVPGQLLPPPIAGAPRPSPLATRLSPTLTTDQLLADARWTGLTRELMLEVIGAARALGFDLPTALADQQLERTRAMGPYKASTLLDFECGRPLELESLFLEPLRQAQHVGAPVPRLAALCHVLRQLDAANNSVASPT